MSGFETASAALAVIQITKHTVTALVNLLQEFNEAGSRLFEIAGEFDCFQWRLKVWCETWCIGAKSQEAEDELVKALWGETGGKSMILQLASIDEECKRFARLMVRLLGVADLSQFNLQGQMFQTQVLEVPNTKRTSFGFLKRFTRDSNSRLYAEALDVAKKATSNRAKADFVMFKGQVFNSILHSLDNKFRKLDDDSFKTFCYYHPDVSRSASHGEIANTVRAETTLQRAFCTRDASRALYHWCLKHEINEQLNGTSSSRPQGQNGSSSYELKLDIGLLANRSDASPGLQFHFAVSWQQNGREQELLVEGPLPDLSSPGVHTLSNSTPGLSLNGTDFETACSTILVKDSERFIVHHPRGSADPVIWFQSKHPVPHTLSFGKASRIRLSDLLEGIQGKTSGEAFEDFPSVERFDLAFKVVEFGLQLLGTSWLSNIRSTQLLRLKCYARKQHWFVLEVESGANDNGTLLNKAEPQTFMIGTLLTEIAIAEPVVGVHEYESQGIRKLALKVIRRDDQGNKEHHAMKLSAAITRVRNCMGMAYGDAVEFCLRQSSISRNPAWAQLHGNCDAGNREDAYKSLLKEFYQEVFLRIKDLYELSRTGRGPIKN